MSGKLRRWVVPLGATAMLLLGAGPAMAGPIVDPGPVAPNQYFTGLVNGQNSEARILVTCDGLLANTGHPAAGQSVQAEHIPPPPIPTLPPQVGFTGGTGKAIDVVVGASDAVTAQVQLRFYHAAVQIPTTAIVPCNGVGFVVFAPVPTSSTTRAARVRVLFVSQAGTVSQP